MKQREEYIPGERERERFDWEEDKAKDDLWELCYVAAALLPHGPLLLFLPLFVSATLTEPNRSFLFFSQKVFYYFCFLFSSFGKKKM